MCSKFPDEMNHLFRGYNLYNVHAVVRSQPILIETFNTMKSDTRCCEMCTYRHKISAVYRIECIFEHYGICICYVHYACTKGNIIFSCNTQET